MAQTPIDYFLRRTSSLLFDIEWAKRWLEPVITYMSGHFGWNPEKEEAYRLRLAEEMRRMKPENR
jgi:glycerol-3-phosphate dehydrogenase